MPRPAGSVHVGVVAQGDGIGQIGCGIDTSLEELAAVCALDPPRGERLVVGLVTEDTLGAVEAVENTLEPDAERYLKNIVTHVHKWTVLKSF